MDIALGLLLYFGSLPLGLLLLAFGSGRKRRRFLICGLGIQVILSLVIVWMTGRARADGYREWYWTGLFHIPVNVLAGLYYLVVWRKAAVSSAETDVAMRRQEQRAVDGRGDVR